MRRNAIGWLVVFWGWHSFIAVAMMVCSGDMIFGYSNRTGLSEGLADTSLPGLFLVTLAAVADAVALALLTVFLERPHRRAPA